MIDKTKLSEYRAIVIEKFINIESIINMIICQHYFKRIIGAFYFEVLYDEYFTFGLKRRILEKIINNFDIHMLHDLNRLNTIRNHFAHYNQEVSLGTDKPPRRKVINPRNLTEEIDFNILYSEFMKKQGVVTDYLFDILKQKGASPTPVATHQERRNKGEVDKTSPYQS